MADLTLNTMDVATFQLDSAHSRQRLAQTRPHAGDERGATTDLETASRQFESLMLNFMIREMRATVPASGLFSKSMTEDVFTSMLDEKYGDLMSRGGGIGLSRMIVEQMDRDNRQGVDEEQRPQRPDKLK